MSFKKVRIPARDGMPSLCIVCKGSLHAKSEYYCSQSCVGIYRPNAEETKPQFLSKWKLRKKKALQDPLACARHKTRKKTRDLLKRGVLKKKPCIVCGDREVIAHHEDYNNPYKIIWICDKHHKEYHEGKRALFNNKLKWDPKRLTMIKSAKIFS